MKQNKNKAKIVVIIPNSRWFGKRHWNYFPYAPLILSSLLKDDFDFHIVDANGGDLDDKQCQDRLQKINPDIVAVSGGSVEYHKQIHHAFSIAKSACPNAISILGGVYPTTLPEESTKDKNIDWHFKYYAEERINDFLNLLIEGRIDECRAFPGIAYLNESGETVQTTMNSYIGDVKNMVKPDYSLVDLTPYLDQTLNRDYIFNSDKPTAYIITSYGCPFNCQFCATRTISGQLVAFRPVEDVLEEIDCLHNEYGVTNFIFLDEALLSKRKRVEVLLKAFIERKRQYLFTWKLANTAAWQLNDELLELMKEAGCLQLTISVESGSQRVLREVIHKPLKLEVIPPIAKKCRELGIDIGASFVIGSVGETWDEIRQTFRFAEECDFDLSHFHIATPLPQTELYKLAKEKGYLAKDFSFMNETMFGYAAGVITSEEFTPFELAVLRAFEWDRINFSTPEKVKRVAKLHSMTIEEMNNHRKQTRKKLGIHIYDT